MNYPKQLMTITELTELGFPKNMIKEASRAKGFPGFKTLKGGKILVDTTRLDRFLDELAARTKRKVS